jgi:thymidylate synthase (FAD)
MGKRINMKVHLMKHTAEPQRTCALAARLCYSGVGIEELNDRLSDEKVATLLADVIRSGHHSVLEHASFTFAIEGVSRALLAQLTRHRIASFSVQSQRYVKFKNDLEYVTPEKIAGDPALGPAFTNVIADIKKLYDRMLEAGIPAEDARYILPQASTTKIILTMNARELRHFFILRCCNRAQWEIRAMACTMLEQARTVAPLLFNGAGPDCVTGPCHEAHPCGKPWPKEH